MARPRVIRKVVRLDRTQRPKVAADRKVGVFLERIKANKEHICHGCRNIVEPGEEYALVTWRWRRRSIGPRLVPESKVFHLSMGCVPPEAKRLVRFLERT